MKQREVISYLTKLQKSGRGRGIPMTLILTFKPVNGGFRCNQTGDFTKKPRQYRNRFKHINLQRQEIEKIKNINQYPPKKPDGDDEIRCDDCYSWIRVKGQKVVQCNCGRKYRIV